jgi:hypothetical protein
VVRIVTIIPEKIAAGGMIAIARTAVIGPHSPVRLAKQQLRICAARYPPAIIAATTIRNLSEALMPSF